MSSLSIFLIPCLVALLVESTGVNFFPKYLAAFLFEIHKSSSAGVGKGVSD